MYKTNIVRALLTCIAGRGLGCVCNTIKRLVQFQRHNNKMLTFFKILIQYFSCIFKIWWWDGMIYNPNASPITSNLREKCYGFETVCILVGKYKYCLEIYLAPLLTGFTQCEHLCAGDRPSRLGDVCENGGVGMILQTPNMELFIPPVCC